MHVQISEHYIMTNQNKINAKINLFKNVIIYAASIDAIERAKAEKKRYQMRSWQILLLSANNS